MFLYEYVFCGIYMVDCQFVVCNACCKLQQALLFKLLSDSSLAAMVLKQTESLFDRQGVFDTEDAAAAALKAVKVGAAP